MTPAHRHAVHALVLAVLAVAGAILNELLAVGIFSVMAVVHLIRLDRASHP